MTTSVIIPQYGEFDLTQRLIRNLEVYEHPTTELIIVDDGSPELDRFHAPPINHLKVVAQPHRGVTAAWNRGVHHSCGEVLIFLNNDVTCTGAWISRLREPLEDRNVVLAGPRMRRERLIPHAVAQEFSRCVLEGWCFAVRRQDFLRVGGFDERFEMYFSDTDFQWRLLKMNQQGCLREVPDLPLKHAGHATTRHLDRRRDVHASDRRKFLQKWSCR
ncbi:MAG: glycosyltransferase [Planctomycetaceae bacterium]|nr:glycosyltransferase [Planctomycetaceae bacterium]